MNKRWLDPYAFVQGHLKGKGDLIQTTGAPPTVICLFHNNKYASVFVLSSPKASRVKDSTMW